MEESATLQTQVSIDFKKNRVRIHKESLRLIGDPKYIQFLVNVKESLVAIRGIDADRRGSHAHRVNRAILASDFSFEIYSQSFTEKLRTTFDGFDEICTYRLTGTVHPKDRAVVFSIDSLQKVESGKDDA